MKDTKTQPIVLALNNLHNAYMALSSAYEGERDMTQAECAIERGNDVLSIEYGMRRCMLMTCRNWFFPRQATGHSHDDCCLSCAHKYGL